MKKQLIWDLPVRLFHWLLVLCIAAQYITAELLEGYMEVHFYIGYFTLGLIIFRLIWGFVGPKYSRFSNFIRSPFAALQYFKLLIQRKNPKYTGHNPLGGWIVPVVILIVGLQAVSGLFTNDDVLYQGPYYAAIDSELQGVFQWLHHNVFNLIIGIIVLHLVAIAWYQLVLKYPLIGAMLSGKKIAKTGIPGSKIILALVIAGLIALFIYWLVVINVPVVEEEFYF